MREQGPTIRGHQENHQSRWSSVYGEFRRRFLGVEQFSSPEDLPNSFFLPSEALGQLGHSIDMTWAHGRERSQIILWHPSRGFAHTREYLGHAHSTSIAFGLNELIQRFNLLRRPVINYHTHTATGARFFSDTDIHSFRIMGMPINLVGTNFETYALVKTRKAMKPYLFRSKEEKEALRRIRHQHIYGDYSRSLEDRIRDAELVGFGVYHHRLPAGGIKAEADLAAGARFTRVTPNNQ